VTIGVVFLSLVIDHDRDVTMTRCVAGQPTELHFHTDSRVREEDENKSTQPYVSFMEGVMTFPKTIGHSARVTGTTPIKAPRTTGTSPRPFHFHTEDVAHRRGGRPLLSKEEQELEMMQALKPFKARPFDPKIMNSAGDLGVPKVVRRKPTEVQPFELETEKIHAKTVEQMAVELARAEQQRQREAHFRAQPLPDTVLVPAAVARPPPKAPTEPEPVKLASDVRAQKREEFEAVRRQRQQEAEQAAAANAQRQQVSGGARLECERASESGGEGARE
jgi:hypothetical protein